MFDTGVFHQQNPWLLQTFGKAEGEGLQLVLCQLRFLLRLDKRQEAIQFPGLLRGVFQMLISNAAKLTGYTAGRFNYYLPLSLKRVFSMHTNFWEKQR
jgi:rhamnosyltransferase